MSGMRERRRAAQKHLAELRDLTSLPQTDEEEWQQWRDFIGSKRTCDDCGLVIGDPEKHDEWHRSVVTRDLLIEVLNAATRRENYDQ